MSDSFCSYPELVMTFMFSIIGSIYLAIWSLTLSLWFLLGIPVIWTLYLRYMEPTWPFDYTFKKADTCEPLKDGEKDANNHG